MVPWWTLPIAYVAGVIAVPVGLAIAYKVLGAEHDDLELSDDFYDEDEVEPDDERQPPNQAAAGW